MKKQTIALTFDVDWAPEEVIEDTLSLLNKYGAKATFFATHKSEVLHNVDPSVIEIGIHPNFNPLLSGSHHEDYKEIVNRLMDEYPSAVGVRSHSLLQSTAILNYFVSVGLKYESNLFFPSANQIGPFKYFNGLIRIPYFWEDDVHFLSDKSFEVKDAGMSEGLNVFDFHPVHVYLNTEQEQTYSNAKEFYHEPDQLFKRRNISQKGTRDFFIQLLEYTKQNDITTIKLEELV